jgi:3,4-dihydroxy 2-butanone 4-phosphate synthase / GTP cyclohydrolase II
MSEQLPSAESSTGEGGAPADVGIVSGADPRGRDRSVFSSIPDALDDIRAGKIVLVVDDADRENEGDFVMAAESCTPEAVNFMVTHGRGIVCLPVAAWRLDELGIPQMVHGGGGDDTAFTVSVDFQPKITTGTSAHDRAATAVAITDPEVRASDFSRPGHVFPLRAREGGVLRRAGHTEAAVDLAQLAGMFPAGVICEVMNGDGTMARLPELVRVAHDHDLKLISIADLIAFRREREQLVTRIAEATIPTAYGEFRSFAYESAVDGRTHVALVLGEIGDGDKVLTRVHSECLTGDVFGSLRCDCGSQLARAMAMVGEEGRGVILYVRGHEGRAIGLAHKLRAYELQDAGRDTVEANLELGFRADQRDYGVGAQILADLGVRTMRLLTNNPDKRAGLEGYGLAIDERIPLQTTPTAENIGYLRTKREKLGHLIDVPEILEAEVLPEAGS